MNDTTKNRAIAENEVDGDLETFYKSFPLVKLFVWKDRIDYRFRENKDARKWAEHAEDLIKELDLPLHAYVEDIFSGASCLLKISKI